MSQGYPYPPSHPQYRSNSSFSTHASSSSSRPRAPPSLDRASFSSSISVPSQSSLPTTSWENPICIDDDDDDDDENSSPSTSHRPTPLNPHQRAPPPLPVFSSSVPPPPPPPPTSKKRQRSSEFSVEDERTNPGGSGRGQSREDGREDIERTKLHHERSPCLSNAVGALALSSNRSSQEPQNHHHVASRRSSEITLSSSSRSDSPASSFLSWTGPATGQHQGRVDKGKGRENPRNTLRMLPPHTPSSSHPSKASSHPGRSLADFFSTPSDPPSEHDLPLHLSPPPSSIATSPSYSSQSSNKRLPFATSAKIAKPSTTSKLPSLEVDGVEWITSDEIDLTSDSPPPSPSSGTSVPKNLIEPAELKHDRLSSTASRRDETNNGSAVVLSLTGLMGSMQTPEGKKDRDFTSWRRSASVRSLPLRDVQEREGHGWEAPRSPSSSSLSTSSSSVNQNQRLQLPEASSSSIASSSASKGPVFPLLPAEIASSSSPRIVVKRREPVKFFFSFSKFPEKEAPIPSELLPVVPSIPVVNKKPVQPSDLSTVYGSLHPAPTRAVKRANLIRRVIDISDSESDSDDDGTTMVFPIAPSSAFVPVIPPSVRLTRKTQHSSLRRFQHEIVQQLSATPTVSSVTFVGQTVPQNFKYKECCVEPGEIGTSKDFSLASCPGDCIHCRGGAHKDLKALTNSGHVRADLMNGKRKFWEECGTCCPSPTTCPFRTSQSLTRDFAVQIFETADKGYGVETVVALPKKKFIGIYSGLVYDTKVIVAISTGCYLFGLQGPGEDDDDEEPCRYEFDLTIDAQKQGNFTRFLNHSCDANVTSVTIIRRDIPGYLHREIPIIGFFTNRDICAGDELTLNYRGDNPYRTYSPEEISEWDKVCRCGAGHLCLGRLNL